MENPTPKLVEKYERNGWPALKLKDLKPPTNLNLSILTSIERIRSHSLSSRGYIACIKDGETLSDVFTMPASGGWLSRFTTERSLVAYWDDEIPQWSPDGNWLAFKLKGHVHIIPYDGGLPKKITNFTTLANRPCWMPDSNGLIVKVERDEIDQLVLTDRDGSWPRALTTDSIGDHWDPQPSPDGQFIVYTLRRFDDLNRKDTMLLSIASGQQETLYGKPSIRSSSPKWSPDGQWISFIAQEGQYEELYMIKPNGEGLHQLTKNGMDVMQYEWSPSGEQMLVVVNRGGSMELMLLEMKSGSLSVLRAETGVHSNPNWAADESYITFEFESSVIPPDLYRMDLKTRQVTQLTFSASSTLLKNEFVHPEVIYYKSFDGVEIPSFLYKPARSNGAAILYPHGGPKAQYLHEWDEVAQYFTAKGYTYIAPNFRGSTGYGKDFERANYEDWGIGDTKDCLYGAKYLQTLNGIKPDRIGIAGGSYGGYMTINALARDHEYLFACGVAKYGDSNLISSWAQCEKDLRLYSEIFMGHPSKNKENYLKGSPIYDVSSIQKPILILHGLLDTVVPPEASEELVELLRREGKTFEYKTYDDEPHGFLRRENRIDVYERMEMFLDWYLLVG